MKRNIIVAVVAVIFFQNAFAQDNGNLLRDSVRVNALIDSSKKFINADPDKAIAISEEARALAQKIGFLKGEAFALKNIGLVYYFQGNKQVQTLDYFNQSLKILREIKDEQGEANLLGNIGAVYANQGDEVNALNNHLQSLKIAEKTGNKLRTFFALNNIGGIYFEKKATWDKALEYLLRAQPLAEETGNTEMSGIILGNIGEIYFERGDVNKALTYYNRSLKIGSKENAPFAYNGLGKVYLKKNNVGLALSYHNQALNIAQKMNEIQIVPSLQGIATVYAAQKDYTNALKYYKQAEEVAAQQKSFPALKDLYSKMAETYANTSDFTNAFKYQRNLDAVKDTLFNEITQKKLGLLQFEFDLDKKQGEINLLTKDKALKEVELNRQRVVKNAFLVGMILVLMIVVIIFRNYRQKVKINKILDKQKEQIELLLLNILPAEVANELQTTGHATPRSYERVSVMFTDFKGFTTIADKMTPEALVDELNNCFMAFDNIIEKYGLEKIKTIGDSYMCAGGIPTPDEDHPHRIIKASLEIQHYIFTNNQRRKAEGLETWDIRIGVHVGPVVAGVVGKKKYAYDVWGSSVNIASRMESSGIPGQVNISAAAYEIVKDQFACIYRGKIHAKNVGEIDMYLVDHELDGFKMGELEQREKMQSPTIIPG
jgi:class 3 adenylate cyclase/tetratricopeptide (TPR) repeat protein